MNDSFLNTGINSSSFNHAQEKAKRAELERRQEKIEERTRLTPAAETLSAWIDEEIAKTQNLELIKIEEMLTDEWFKSELMARKKYIEYLKTLKSKISNTLREPARKVES